MSVEKSNVDTSIDNIIKLYPITDTFKLKQKASNGRSIPFEIIDKTFYKSNANCACFITSNERMHGWISALANIIYNGEGVKAKNVTWIDKKDSNEKIVQIEFVVYDKSIDLSDVDGFLYKIIVYLTTGKILIQGKEWEMFCGKLFDKCKIHVDTISSSPTVSSDNDQSIAKLVVTPEKSSEMINVMHETSEKLIANDCDTDKDMLNSEEVENSKETTNNKSTRTTDRGSTETNTKMNCSNPVMGSNSVESINNEIDKVNNRLNVFEQSLLTCSDSITSLLTLQKVIKDDILKEIKTLTKSVCATNQPHPDLKLVESQILDKNLEIKGLQTRIDQLHKSQTNEEMRHKKELESVKTEYEKQITTKQSETSNKEREIDNLNHKIDVLIKEKEQLKSNFEKSSFEKDEVIRDLQDRIQSFLYDCNGEPWCKVNDKNQTKQQSDIHVYSDNNTNTCQSDLPISDQTKPVLQTTQITAPSSQHDTSTSQPVKLHTNYPPRQAMTDIPHPTETFDVLFCHDSICHPIDINKLLQGTGHKGDKRTTYTVEEVSAQLDSTKSANKVIIHVGINDLKQQPTEVVYNKYMSMIEKALSKSSSVTISLVVPCKYEKLTEKVMEFNDLISAKFGKSEGIYICRNDNFFRSDGRLDFKLYENAARLSRDHGIKVLAANLRHTFGIHELSPHISVEKEKEAKIDHLCQHRLKSKPVPYIIGEWDFHDLVLKMKEPVFIPRPETEDLADYVCDSIEQNGLQTGRLLDMCCGSGALAIHILNRFKEMRGISIDKLTEACDLTKENAAHHLIHDRLSVLQHDLFNEDLLNHLNPYLPFDIIVSNPPYIPTKNLKNLQPEILRYESHEALDGGEDGMDAIRRIVDLAPRLMDSGGQVWLEVDLGEPEMIEDMLCQNSKVVFIKTLPDFTKRNRFCVLQVK